MADKFVTDIELKKILADFPKEKHSAYNLDFNQIASYIIGYGSIAQRPFVSQERMNAVFVEKEVISSTVTVHRLWQCIAKQWIMVASTDGGDLVGVVESVTGLNTNNTDPANPIVQISVDGVTITGDGTPGNPLVSVSTGGGGYTIVAVNFAASPYTIVPITGTYLYQVDCTGGAIVINFPTAVGSDAIWGIKKIDSSLNTITLTPFGAQTIDGNATQTILFQNTEVDIYSNNANLFIK
jgi:hypothetical protein